MQVLKQRVQALEKLRYMHRNPVKDGLVKQPEQWDWSSHRSYAYAEDGKVKINQWPKAELRTRPAA
jgi:putative transposase